ncbi:hypothetical protein ABPG74_011388 [Tetrahymena malaccensis]
MAEIQQKPINQQNEEIVKVNNSKVFIDFIIQVITVIAFCLPGVLIRILLLNLTSKHEIFIQNSDFLPNSVGSFVMGIFQSPDFKSEFSLMHLGITVGFCGSLTTFSSWIIGILVKQENKYIAVDIICGIILPLIFVYMGRKLADIAYFSRKKQKIINLPQQQIEANTQIKKNIYYEIAVIVFIIIFEIIGFSIAFSSYFDLNYLYEILFGPVGALPRYIMSTKLNNLISCFQLGTFLSNWFGTIIAFILEVTCIQKSICYQIQFGSMGSLSTVSSWANDTINNFEKNKFRSLLYNLGTFGVCIVSAIIVNEISKIKN